MTWVLLLRVGRVHAVIMKAVWPTTASDRGASAAATMVTPAAVHPTERAGSRQRHGHTRKPVAAGMVRKNPSLRPRTKASRKAAVSPFTCIRDSRGTSDSATGAVPRLLARV